MGNLVQIDNDRLIKNTYLHSVTNNFLTAAASIRVNKLRVNTSKLTDVQHNLQAIIDKLNADVNAMYQDLGIKGQDSVSYTEDGVIYNPMGAREFSERFLNRGIFNTSEQNLFQNSDDKMLKNIKALIDRNGYTVNQNGDLITEHGQKITVNEYIGRTVLGIIDSPASISFLNTMLSKNRDRLVSELASNYRSIEALLGKDAEMAEKMNLLTDKVSGSIEQQFNKIGKEIEKMFVKQSGGRFRMINKNGMAKGLKRTDIITQASDIQQLLDYLGLNPNELKMTHKEDVEKIKKTLETKMLNSKIYESLGQRYYDYFLKPQFDQIYRNAKWRQAYEKKHEPITLESLDKKGLKLRRFFVNSFKETLLKYSAITFEDKDKSAKGFVLEFGTLIQHSIARDGMWSKSMVQILGQETERRVMTTAIRQKGKEITEKEELTGPVQSASDIVFKGKYKKREYRLQLKNSFEEGKTLSFRAQPTIKMKTFLPTAIENERDREELGYMLVNLMYLKNNGLTKYGTGDQPLKTANSKNGMMTNAEQKLKYYINFLLEAGYYYILGSEYKIDKEGEVATQKGNIAYIYQTQYLIPVAAFFVSAYDMLSKLIKWSRKIGDAAIGGLNLPTFEGQTFKIKTDSKEVEEQIVNWDKHTLYNNKIGIIDELGKSGNLVKGVHHYPDELLEYGSQYGERIYNNISFRLRITLFIDKIQKLLKM